ncbi:aldehyde ferredoxin oxidoreductase [Candidatus Bathyarchaeota archaeon]|nr:aldehyde ferredoxin oxidoreductase [Candidatus Bathyarchaeota archaeon]|tara:strand:- start:623 stop:2422 length:1800 start_codon:yes stop_codon:yes gene_type:complete
MDASSETGFNLLKVDLTLGKIGVERLDAELTQNYIGGTGVGVKLFVDSHPKGVDPIGPDNSTIIATGPLTGSRAPTSGRFSLVTRSPLTETIFDSNSGGNWGVKLKRCGFDGVWITGRSKDPVFLKISTDEAELRGADTLWGKDISETSNALRATEGDSISVLAIGPAGENLVKISSIMNDEHRAFGRGGVGAVWGSKNLKAMVVERGTKLAEVSKPESFQRYIESAFRKIVQGPITGQALRLFGTSVLVNIINEFGLFPIKNNQSGCDVRAENISGERIKENIFVKPEACFNCPISCGRVTKTAGRSGKGPEYESVWALGAQCGIFDLEAITEANYECNLLGLDTISTGATISCAMEISERGFLEGKIGFGDANVLQPLIRKIAFREGIGMDLAEGSVRFARKQGAEECAMAVKGLELPAYDPRGSMGQALSYATSNRGGCHLRGYMVGWEVLGSPKMLPRFNISGKTDILMRIQNLSRVTDSLVTCKFLEYSVGYDHLARILSASTGINYTISGLQKIGERIWNLERLYNIREGIDGTQDTLPSRFLKDPLKEGSSSGQVVDLDKMLVEYYQTRGWNEEGVPTSSKLDDLGLEVLGA